jgi:phospholipid/cholesterol/gamma-HCH transport system substrate-binding protein
MTGTRLAGAKFGAFALTMLLLTGMLFLVFGQYRTGSATSYSAVFADVSRLKAGDTVRAAGIQVGTVQEVALHDDGDVVVTFDADRSVMLTEGTKAAVRYLNLVGDRYLELLNGPGPPKALTAGAQIPLDRTTPALDLDLLLGGLKPVLRGLNPQDVNALSASLLQILQGQGGTLESLLSKTSSFTNELADNHQVLEEMIDNLNAAVGVFAKDGDQFAATVERLQQLVTQLADDRDPIGSAIESLTTGTASVADLLTHARPPLAGTVNELNRLAPLLDQNKELLDVALQKAPDNYRKMIRPGSYGAFLNGYLCAISLRVTDLQGRTAAFPWIRQDSGRCEEP